MFSIENPFGGRFAHADGERFSKSAINRGFAVSPTRAGERIVTVVTICRGAVSPTHAGGAGFQKVFVLYEYRIAHARRGGGRRGTSIMEAPSAGVSPCRRGEGAVN